MDEFFVDWRQMRTWLNFSVFSCIVLWPLYACCGIIIIIVEEKKTYGYELRVTLHHCNMILYTVRKCNN